MRRYEGYYGNPIHMIKAEIVTKKQIRKFIENFLNNLSKEELELLCSELDERMDDFGVLHIRIDKQKAYLGSISLTKGADSIVIKIKIPSYPQSKEGSVERAKEILCKDLEGMENEGEPSQM